jgi:hypothetical protein
MFLIYENGQQEKKSFQLFLSFVLLAKKFGKEQQGEKEGIRGYRIPIILFIFSQL